VAHYCSAFYKIASSLVCPLVGQTLHQNGGVFGAQVTSKRRIANIVRHTPVDAADEIVVISDASFSRVYRDNNRRILMCQMMPHVDADEGVVDLIDHARVGSRLEEIVADSGLPESVAYHAIMRMIGTGRIGAERDAVIDYPSQIWSTKQ
jgi:hypothetical protein